MSAAAIIVVAISGKMGSGKSMLAEYITSSIGRDRAIRSSFGDAVKYAAALIFEFSPLMAYRSEGKCSFVKGRTLTEANIATKGKALPELTDAQFTEVVRLLVEGIKKIQNGDARKKITVGRTLQLVGEAVREVYPTYWVKAFEAKLVAEIGSRHLVVIDDLRHLTEMDWVNQHRLCIKVKIVIKQNEGDKNADPASAAAATTEDGRDKNHVSETQLDSYGQWDYVIENDGKTFSIIQNNTEILATRIKAALETINANN